jgi:hypothetical protein
MCTVFATVTGSSPVLTTKIRNMEIFDFIGHLSKENSVEFLFGENNWKKGTIIGVDLEKEEVKIKTESNSHWTKLYYQLGSGLNRNPKVRIPYEDK